jgi:hypothetical protein
MDLLSVPSPAVMNNIVQAPSVRAVCQVPFGTTT